MSETVNFEKAHFRLLVVIFKFILKRSESRKCPECEYGIARENAPDAGGQELI